MLSRFIMFFATFLLSVSVLASEVADVSIKKFEFIPKEITVKKGTKVRWTNNEKRQYHSVWFEERGDAESDYFFPEETYELEFNEVGTFPYRCGPHPKMLGVVIVTE
ncbi:cupredoxin domain-containing protein [Alkalimarinus alittae]|uniref:Plastocyanin/azurin family copper-binding protein n=1 Tax=Alkalimarinus alittae TaxID=2961619 RepID=A0ABY6N698_9ALTE|nr:plastocyanin/azurin family copper-binding protein [Alkalimarinus alittae]UZE97517.1 plastocyanin/azurin family copper-binding protein [Alkalimarinus alittae]